MFQDIKVSDDLNIKFFDYLKLESPSTTVQNPTMTNFLGLDFNIYVLQVIINCNFHENHFLFIQVNSWPVTKPMTNTFSIPQLLEKPLRLVIK